MSREDQSSELDVRYNEQAALYTSQFMIHAGEEDVAIDCISRVEAASEGKTVVPVHTKLALSWGAVERLASLLNDALEQRDTTAQKHVPTPHIALDAAKLPSFGEAGV